MSSKETQKHVIVAKDKKTGKVRGFILETIDGQILIDEVYSWDSVESIIELYNDGEFRLTRRINRQDRADTIDSIMKEFEHNADNLWLLRDGIKNKISYWLAKKLLSILSKDL